MFPKMCLASADLFQMNFDRQNDPYFNVSFMVRMTQRGLVGFDTVVLVTQSISAG